MCLTIDSTKTIKWPKSGYRIFYKSFRTGILKKDSHNVLNVLIGSYQSNYIYLPGWNYPTSDKIQIGKYIYAGVLHVKTIKLPYMTEYRPIICHKNDLVYFGEDNEACFKRIFIPKVVYNGERQMGKALINEVLKSGELSHVK